MQRPGEILGLGIVVSSGGQVGFDQPFVFVILDAFFVDVSQITQGLLVAFSSRVLEAGHGVFDIIRQVVRLPLLLHLCETLLLIFLNRNCLKDQQLLGESCPQATKHADYSSPAPCPSSRWRVLAISSGIFLLSKFGPGNSRPSHSFSQLGPGKCLQLQPRSGAVLARSAAHEPSRSRFLCPSQALINWSSSIIIIL